MVTNYSNPTSTTVRVIDQSSRRVAGIIPDDANGAQTSQVKCWLQADGSHTGNFQCHVYDHSGILLTQIGSNVDVSTLTGSLVEYTFTATVLQQTNSQFATDESGYIAFSIDGSGQCSLAVESTTLTTYSAIPKKSTSTSDPFSFHNWDGPGNQYYFKGTVSFVAGSNPTTRLPPPPLVAYF